MRKSWQFIILYLYPQKFKMLKVGITIPVGKIGKEIQAVVVEITGYKRCKNT
jgi:hypothetical protein